jgi:hypothetical protein
MGQGCQMVCFQTKNPNLGKFWRVLQWKSLVYFTTIWRILLLLEIFNCRLVYIVVIWYIFPSFGILCQEKSGNPSMGDNSPNLVTLIVREGCSYLNAHRTASQRHFFAEIR